MIGEKNFKVFLATISHALVSAIMYEPVICIHRAFRYLRLLGFYIFTLNVGFILVKLCLSRPLLGLSINLLI